MNASIDTSRYIAFEGVEGAGKSSVARHVAESLAAAGESVLRVREPGGTLVGEAVRTILLGGDHDPSPRAEASLFAAARAQLISERVVPALSEGSWVLSDRSVYSSLAYQAIGRGLDPEEIRSLNDIAIGGVWPGTVVLLRLNSGEGLRRQSVGDRIGDAPPEFHERVAGAFEDLAAAEPDRFIVVDASLPLDAVYQNTLVALGFEL